MVRFKTLILLVILGTQFARGGEPTPLTDMDVFNLEYASDPQISPDGTRIVYVRRFADVMTDQFYSNLWIVGFDGSNHRPLTSGNRRDNSPRWSPDGTRLVYLSDEHGSTQIYLRWMDTGQTAKLTNVQQAPQSPIWSPDGSQISFVGFVPSEPISIAKMPAAPKDAKWAEPAMVIDQITYRFDKKGYLKPGFFHLFVMPAEPGTPQQLTSGNFHHGASPSGGGKHVWAPDGKSIIVSANRHADFEFQPLNSEIYEVSISDGEIKTLTDRLGPDSSPAISPDGKLIAYTGFDDRFQGHQTTMLYVMNRDGTGVRTLTTNLDRTIDKVEWVGNGDGLVVMYDDEGNTHVDLCSLDGKLTPLAKNLGGTGSAYGGGTFSVSTNGHIAFNQSTPDMPGDVGVTTIKKEPSRVVTNINRDLLSQRKLGAVEEIWYESSKDKRRVQGWIIKPPDFDSARKYPLILEIHGGPFANYGDRFDVEKQYWAGKGYVVLYTNPRGSTSYGEEFGNLIHHSYPGDDFYDLDAGVDAMVAKGYVDPDSLFITGGSGGGVLTCWMIAKTDRFRAAASQYPVINWYSFTLNADLSVFFWKYWFPGLPWDHTQHYMDRSLTSVVKNVKTPTMIITGEEDWRTPISESEQYYKALKLLKVESVLVRVPDEPHGIRQRPSHHIAKMLNIVGWFEKFRKNTESGPAAEGKK